MGKRKIGDDPAIDRSTEAERERERKKREYNFVTSHVIDTINAMCR